jgi:D-amino peptidase
MKIYVMVDMEGISGIRKIEQVKKDFPAEYSNGCKLMTMEINEVVKALYDYGATEVVVRDTHGTGGQINISDMDPRAIYESSDFELMPSLDESFDGLILLGHHSKAGTLNGFLDHTMSSESWFSFKINGVELGEIGLEAAYAGHFHVPVIVVTGDETTIKEAKETLGTVEGSVVKWGIGRNRAKCLSLPEAYERIRDSIRKGLELTGKLEAFKPQLPAVIEITFYRSDYVDRVCKRTDIERVNARTIRKVIYSLKDITTCW